MSLLRAKAFLSFLVLLVAFGAGEAMAQPGPAAQRVIERARAASGGAAWNAVRGLHEVGAENGAPYERWLDTLRFGDRFETTSGGGKRVGGYNGFGTWGFLPAAMLPRVSAEQVLARARSDAFFAAYGYYFTGRFDLRGGVVGARQAGGQTYDVVWVEPAGGDARELWFDRKTGLLSRMVERGRPRPLTIELSDYRRVGRLMLPFVQTTYGGDLPQPLVRRLERVEAVAPDRAMFSLPRTAAR